MRPSVQPLGAGHAASQLQPPKGCEEEMAGVERGVSAILASDWPGDCPPLQPGVAGPPLCGQKATSLRDSDAEAPTSHVMASGDGALGASRFR